MGLASVKQIDRSPSFFFPGFRPLRARSELAPDRVPPPRTESVGARSGCQWTPGAARSAASARGRRGRPLTAASTPEEATAFLPSRRQAMPLDGGVRDLWSSVACHKHAPSGPRNPSLPSNGIAGLRSVRKAVASSTLAIGGRQSRAPLIASEGDAPSPWQGPPLGDSALRVVPCHRRRRPVRATTRGNGGLVKKEAASPLVRLVWV